MELTYEELYEALGGNLSPSDEVALQAYVDAIARHNEAQVNIKRLGSMVKDDRGKPVPNPFLQISKQALDQAQSLAKQLKINEISNTEVRSDKWKLPAPPEYTTKQLAFAREYAKTRKATQAALAAGYSQNSAAVSASSMLKMPKIQQLIDKEVRKLQLIESRSPEDIFADVRILTQQALDQGDIKLALECLRLEGRYSGAFGEGNKLKGQQAIILPLYQESPYTE